jgi:hypothetical protein
LPILYWQPRGVAPRWLEPRKRTVLSGLQIQTKREKLNVLTWNRRLSKAGNGARVGADQHKRYNRFTTDSTYGLPIVPERPELKYLQVYRIRKDRSANGYRTEKKEYEQEMDGLPSSDTVFWVEDTRTGAKVTDLSVLKAVVDVVNDGSKFGYQVGEPTTPGLLGEGGWKRYEGKYTIGKPSRGSKKGQITFDKHGPEPLTLHQLGVSDECNCDRCRPTD